MLLERALPATGAGVGGVGGQVGPRGAETENLLGNPVFLGNLN